MDIKQQTEDEILEQQRAESLAAFAKKSVAIQNEIRNYEGKLSNLKELFEMEHEKMLDSVKLLEEELIAKKQDVENKEALVNAMTKDIQIRLYKVIKLEDDLNERYASHADAVNNHVDASEQEKEIIRQRHTESILREENSKSILEEAKNKLLEAIAEKQSIEEQASKLISISDAITKDIAIQKELQNNNETLKRQIEESKIEMEQLKNQAENFKAEAVQIRDDCDNMNARLAKRKTELDEIEKQQKSNIIRQEVIKQQQDQREQYINEQMGKLSQLKNDVDILLKKREEKGA